MWRWENRLFVSQGLGCTARESWVMFKWSEYKRRSLTASAHNALLVMDLLYSRSQRFVIMAFNYRLNNVKTCIWHEWLQAKRLIYRPANGNINNYSPKWRWIVTDIYRLWVDPFTDTEVNNCFSIYHTSWIISGPKSYFMCDKRSKR